MLVGTSDERAGIEVLGAMNLRRSGGFRRGTKIARQTLIWLTIFVIRRRRFDFIGDISTPCNARLFTILLEERTCLLVKCDFRDHGERT